MRLPPDEPESAGPNMTPVIDVVFLLLIFFLVATRFDHEERESPVNLPEVAEAQPLTMTADLVVNVTREGRYGVLNKEYSEADLLAVLQESRRANPQRVVRIRADADTAWKYGVRVMGLCNKAGIRDYRVVAIPEK